MIRSICCKATAAPAAAPLGGATRMHNDGSHIISLGTLCRWLGKQAEALGVEIYPGFAASTLIVEEGRVRGGDRRSWSRQGGATQAGSRARHGPVWALYPVCRRGARPPRQTADRPIPSGKYRPAAALRHRLPGRWQVPAGQSHPGRVLHGSGWPLGEGKGNKSQGASISIIWPRIRWRSALSSISTTRILAQPL